MRHLIELVLFECHTLDDALLVSVLLKHFFYLLKVPGSTIISVHAHKDSVNHLVDQAIIIGRDKSLEIHGVEATFRLDASEGDLIGASSVLLFLVNYVSEEFFFSYCAISVCIYSIECNPSHLHHFFRRWSDLAFRNRLVIKELCNHITHLIEAPVVITVRIECIKDFVDQSSYFVLICCFHHLLKSLYVKWLVLGCSSCELYLVHLIWSHLVRLGLVALLVDVLKKLLFGNDAITVIVHLTESFPRIHHDVIF